MRRFRMVKCIACGRPEGWVGRKPDPDTHVGRGCEESVAEFLRTLRGIIDGLPAAVEALTAYKHLVAMRGADQVAPGGMLAYVEDAAGLSIPENLVVRSNGGVPADAAQDSFVQRGEDGVDQRSGRTYRRSAIPVADRRRLARRHGIAWP